MKKFCFVCYTLMVLGAGFILGTHSEKAIADYYWKKLVETGDLKVLVSAQQYPGKKIPHFDGKEYDASFAFSIQYPYEVKHTYRDSNNAWILYADKR